MERQGKRGQTGETGEEFDVYTPEMLRYKPEKNGNLRLVAVEYIIPYTFHSRESDPNVNCDNTTDIMAMAHN